MMQTDVYAASDEKLPDTPAGKRAEEILNFLNSADRNALAQYISDNFSERFKNFAPLEEHLNFFSDVHDRNQGFELHEIQKSDEYSLTALVRSQLTGLWLNILIRVSDNPPHRIDGIGLRPAAPPEENSIDKNLSLSDQDVVTYLEAFLKKQVEADVFSGTVLLAKNGDVLFKGAYGMASKRFGVPNKIDTKFNLGSMNKMFTAVAIAQLVEKGKLSYDDNLGKYLGEDWIRPEVGNKVRIKHLLSHTSGLGSYFNKKFMESSRLLYRFVDDYKPLIKDDSLRFEPGTRWHYSNTGMFLLGAVIEKVTGQNYFDYVRENIFKPAGMTNTDSYEMDRPVPNLAIGYSKEFGDQGTEWKNNIYHHVVKGGPAGGGFSTAEDLLKFDQALRSHKLISKESTDLLMSPKPELNSPQYGYGFGIQQIGDESVVGHSGGFPGISSVLRMYLRSGYTVVILSNYSRGMQPVNQKIEELLLSMEK
jgi:CubicO group peptidase (beta-lactamase class C family)